MTFWTKCFLKPKESNEFQEHFLKSDLDAKVLMAVLNSNLYFYIWNVVSDCWHVTNKELKMFKVDIDKMNSKIKDRLYALANSLEKDLELKKREVNNSSN